MFIKTLEFTKLLGSFISSVHHEQNVRERNWQQTFLVRKEKCKKKGLIKYYNKETKSMLLTSGRKTACLANPQDRLL